MRRAMPDDEQKSFAPLEAAQPTVLIAGVDSATFEYFGAENDFTAPQWTDSWKWPNRMPEMVRLRIRRIDGPLPEMIVRLNLGEGRMPRERLPAQLPSEAHMRRAQRGVALVLVMWVAILLTVIASAFIVERRTEAMVISNSISMARAEAIADAGVQRAIFELYRNDNSPDAWKRDGTRYAMELDGVPVSVEIRDESAKIDINTATEPLLRGLLVSSGLPDDEATRVLDAILDWRDPDDLKRPNGAEEPEYKAAGLSYKPANGPFQAIEELQLVLGMRPELYRRMAPSITVFSRSPGVNTQIATREVLLAIPGATTEVVDDYIARREAARTRASRCRCSRSLPASPASPWSPRSSPRRGSTTARCSRAKRSRS
jgi:general secretion pathway protein K